MLNLAGREYDFGPVLFAVLQDCEHRRRSLPADDAETAARVAEIARQKLAEVRACYEEAGGTPGYWRELESEVMETALPQYMRAAVAQTRLELASYGLWRQGDPLSRVALGLAGLAVGGLIVKAPFIPIFEDAFAFALAVGAFLYPEIKRLVFDWRYSRLLNRLIAQAESYQHRKLPYVSEAGLEAELRAVSVSAPRTSTAGATGIEAAGATGIEAAGSSAAGQARPAMLNPSRLSIFAPSEATPAKPDAQAVAGTGTNPPPRALEAAPKTEASRSEHDPRQAERA
jgi:hypothetical protein